MSEKRSRFVAGAECINRDVIGEKRRPTIISGHLPSVPIGFVIASFDASPPFFSMPDAPEAERLLSPGQGRIVGFALTLFTLIGSIALIVFVLAVLGRVIGVFSGLLWPLAVAGVLALIMRPLVDQLQRRLRGRRLPAVIILFGAFVCAVTGLLVTIGPPLAGQVLDLVAYAPDFWTKAHQYVHEHYPAWIQIFERLKANPAINGLLASAQTQLTKLPGMVLPSLRAVSEGVAAAFGFLTHLAIIPIYLFFFLLSRAEPTRRLPNHLSFVSEPFRSDLVFLVREFIAIVVSFFRGQLLIGLIMGILLAVGFTTVGLNFGLVIGLLLGVLNIVPYLGTIIGLIVTLPLAFFQPDGGLKLVALVLLVYIVVQNIEGFFLTPKIMGDRTGLHPVVIIVAIFFWGTAFDGVLGMILAIPLTAFFVTVWRLLKQKYFRDPPDAPVAIASTPLRR